MEPAQTTEHNMRRIVLWGIAALVFVPHPGFAQQGMVPTHTITWAMFDFKADSPDQSIWAFGTRGRQPTEERRRLGTSPPSLTEALAEMSSPRVKALALHLNVDKLTFSVAVPIEATAPALPQSYGNLPFAFGNTTGYLPSGMCTCDGLVQFVAGIKLNIGSPNDAAFGFSWNVQYAPGSVVQNSNLPNIGLAFRYRLSF